MATPRVLMVIPFQQFRDEELFVPRQHFTDAGWPVTTASTQAGTAAGMLGASESITVTLDSVVASEFDVLVVVGGMGSPEDLWNNKPLHQLIQTMATNHKVLSAICLSGAVLGLAGVLTGKQATVYETPESRKALEDNGATFTGEAVTIDGQIITANGPDAAGDFAKAIIQVAS